MFRGAVFSGHGVYTTLKGTFNGFYNSDAETTGLSSILHSFSRCWLPNLRNHAKFRENSNCSKSSKVIGLSVNQSKAHMRLPVSH